jgi:hypothetical protein
VRIWRRFIRDWEVKEYEDEKEEISKLSGF